MKDIQNGKLNIWRVYLRRYLRLTPLLFFLLLATFLSLHFGSNSPMVNTKVLERKCFDCWWTLLLHVQNFVKPLDMVTNESLLFKLKIRSFQCIGQGWTISLDFQLTFVTPLLVFLICKWKKSQFVIFPSLVLITQYLIMKQTEIEGIPDGNL
jgi:peptidoglycan/LPS O-acetylase OafA/YrhL